MKIAVMGAGAVGCYFGARLRQAGHDVTLIGRAETVAAARIHGLRLQMQGYDGYLSVRAATDPSAVEGADLVLFCVKSGDTESAGASIKPFVTRDCKVLCLQNGVDNAERLSHILTFEAVPVAVYVAVSMAAPAHVVHHGRGDLIMGLFSGSGRVAHAFEEAGIPVQVTAGVMNALWAKLAANCAYNALSALTDLPYGELAQRQGMKTTLRSIVAECATVAHAAGITIPSTLWDDVYELSRSMASQRSSMAQDVARGRTSEIEYINGYVVRQGERFGVDVPLNLLLHSLVKMKDDALAAADEKPPA